MDTLCKLRFFVPQEMVYDQNISGYDLAVYIELRRFAYNYMCERLLFHSSSIAYLLVDTYPSKEQIMKCTQSLTKLFKNGYVTGEIIKKTFFSVNTEEITHMNGLFTDIYYDDIRKILNSNKPYKYNLIKYFMVIMENRKFGKDANPISDSFVSWFSNMVGKNAATLNSYNKALENMGILYICRSLYERKPNIYGSYRDRTAIDAYAQTHRYMSGSDSVSANKGRRLCQIYNQIAKGREYPLEVRKEVFQYMKQRNETYRSLAAKEPEAGHEKKIVDIDIIKV